MIRSFALLALGTLAVAGIAQAQQAAPTAPPRPPPARAPETALALEAAQTAISTCSANGYTVAVSIVDAAGVLKLFLDKDGASKGAIETSTKKATTALALKAKNSDVMEQMKTDKALAAKIEADPTLFVRAGGVPITVGSDFIGAIGVGGAPGGDKDEACAIAGIDKIKARLK
jgi:uncharacterized protein GlcG (DUF336 family)